MSSTEAIGVDLGGTKMLVGVLDRDSQVAWESREKSTGQSEEQLMDLLVREIEAARQARRGSPRSGSVSRRRSTTIAGSRLGRQPADREPADPRSRRERTGLPVFVDNDANVAALAEHLFGAARGCR